MNKLYHDTGCVPNNRCKKYRDCDTCNGIRQKRYCDIALLASRFSPKATYAVVMPYGDSQNPQLIKDLKTNISRKLRRSTDGMLATVETSPNDALHLNFLINSKEELTPIVFQKACKNLGAEADIFVESIDNHKVPRVIAYALKRQSIPRREQFSGNLVNTYGGVKTVANILQSERMIKYAPLVATEAMLQKIHQITGHKHSAQCLENPDFLSKAQELHNLSLQVDKFNLCYHPKLGIMTKSDVQTYYTNWIVKRNLNR